MAATSTVLAGVAAASAATGAGYAIYSGEQQKEEAKKNKKTQEIALAGEKSRAALDTSKNLATSKQSEALAQREKAATTQKVSERDRRRGKKSLLTGSESGLATIY